MGTAENVDVDVDVDELVSVLLSDDCGELVPVVENANTFLKSSVVSVIPIKTITAPNISGMIEPWLTQESSCGLLTPRTAEEKTNNGKHEVRAESTSTNCNLGRVLIPVPVPVLLIL